MIMSLGTAILWTSSMHSDINHSVSDIFRHKRGNRIGAGGIIDQIDEWKRQFSTFNEMQILVHLPRH